MQDFLFNSSPHMTPAKLAEVTGLSADMQRDWRRREYIANLGTQSDTGRWLYDWYDAFILFLMRKMYEGGCELPRAQIAAATVGQDVLMFCIEARFPGKVFPRFRYHRFVKDERGKPEHGGWVSIRFNDLSRQAPVAVGLLIDCVALANELPRDFDEAINALNVIVNDDLKGRDDAG